MLEEYFQEADVMSPEQGFGDRKKAGGQAQACRCTQHSSASSKPIDVPPARRAKVGRRWSTLEAGRDEEEEEEEEDDERKMLPPHELVASGGRNGEKVACSVCFGNGRTLKGRDLQRFRNSVLRMTGFLER